MGLLEALVLGLLGGVADVLPVGASGHRIVVGRALFGSPYNPRFAGACEISSALAVLAALRKDVGGLASSALRTEGQGRQLVFLLAVAAVTTVLISLPFVEAAAGVRGNLGMVGVLLLVSGLLLYVAEELGRRTRDLGSLGLPGALLVGLLQTLAVLPGISRTGAAISGGMLLGITREAATRLALLLSVPLLLLSGVWNLSTGGAAGFGVVALGCVASFAGAFVAVGVLRWFVKEFSLMAFAYYLWAAGLLTILYETLS